MGRGFLPLLAGCPQTVAALGPYLGGQARPKLVPGAAPRPLGANKERQRRRLSGPNASHAEGLLSEVGARGVQGGDELPLYPRNGWQGGAPFSADSGLETEQLRWLGRGPGKENEKKGNERSVAQVFCVMRGGLGGARAQPRRRPLHPEGPARGGWNLADGFGLGGWGRLAIRWQAQRGYLIFWAHFMSSARGFSPVRPWMRSSRRRQKPIFSRG